MTSHRLSKSRFTAGLQCHKQLWWRVHDAQAPELRPDVLLQATFDRGHRVGEAARGYVPGGTLVDLPHGAVNERVALTSSLLADGARAVYEASFVADDVFVAVDILERREHGFTLIEVKSTASVKDEHIPDAAIQTHVLRRAGLEVPRVELMHLSRECRFPDLSNLFARRDVTNRVEEVLPEMPRRITEQLAALDGPLPDVAVGDHCFAPYECPFLARCWPTRPEHHVGTLYRWGRKAAELEARGYATIADLPDGLDLGVIAERQRRAVRAGRMIVEAGLAEALAPFLAGGPLGFLDFETVGPAIPVWRGCRPYDAVPVQFSFVLDRHDGRPAHHEWLAVGPGDPRPALAERLLDACGASATVVAYNATFERQCIRGLAEAVPALAAQLLDLQGRLVDLLPVVRNHVYHPGFHGSFSLKAVLPALVPELTYADLAIGDGDMASMQLERLLLGPGMDASERARLRAALLAYCERDTWAMVRLLERLRELAPV
jgi:hypothetical protein